MTIIGLDGEEVTALVRGASVQPLEDADGVAERFARGAWTMIAEPGDSVAGAVVRRLGAAGALAALVSGGSAATLIASCPNVEPDAVAKGLERWTPRLRSSAAKRAFAQAARFDTRLLAPGDALWPAALDDLGDHAPLALWVRGADAALEHLDRGMALVGARAATGYGEHVAMEASAGLVERGYAIVSGAAYGIDGMAHRAALARGGMTVAFLAGGLDRFYPSGHEALLAKIAAEGAAISEVPCGTPPTKWRFLQRNRLIGAASVATVVLEAGWRSGSLNTAGHAAALGRPLGAVPGPVTSAASAGCHRLIREFDAVCVTSAEEMAELAPLSDPPHRGVAPGPSAAEVRVIDALSAREPREPLDLAARSGMSVAEVQSALGLLELAGSARQAERGWVRK